MAIRLSSLQIQELVKARQAAHLTQLELSNLAKVSLRTIKDLESERRKVFYESTIIGLCRTLNVSYSELVGSESSDNASQVNGEPPKRRPFFALGFVLAVGLLVAAGIYLQWVSNESRPAKRTDYIRPCDELIPDINDPVWLGNDSVYVYYYLSKSSQMPKVGEVDSVEIRWAHHFQTGSRPVYCVSAYTSWDPSKEIRIFKRTLSGQGVDTIRFDYTAPKKNGEYRLRVFFVPAYNPVPNFYGKPPLSQVISPSFGYFVQIPIEVLPK
jgi:transcriptional regulator with XRE-family HTH domain